MTILVLQQIAMTISGATKAKAHFSAVLDKAESEGPQLLQRRKTKFVLLTEAEWEGSRALEHTAAIQEPTQAAAGTRSLWDRLRLVPCDGIDPVFPRMQGKPRHIDF
jgi:PHD/YefM family antitoxin component YafN of YafNO toxin-antitoxin module